MIFNKIIVALHLWTYLYNVYVIQIVILFRKIVCKNYKKG